MAVGLAGSKGHHPGDPLIVRCGFIEEGSDVPRPLRLATVVLEKRRVWGGGGALVHGPPSKGLEDHDLTDYRAGSAVALWEEALTHFCTDHGAPWRSEVEPQSDPRDP